MDILTVQRKNFRGLPGGPLGCNDPVRLAHDYLPSIGCISKMPEDLNLFAGPYGLWEGSSAQFLLYPITSRVVDTGANPWPWIKLDPFAEKPNPEFDPSILVYIEYLQQQWIPKHGNLKVAV